MRKKRLAWIMAAALLGTGMCTTPGAAADVSTLASAAGNAALQEQRLNTFYSQAIQSINDQDYKNALMCLDGCMIYCTQESNPVLYADLFMKRGYCCLMLEQYDEALEALDTALETDPELENAMLIKASAYSEKGELEEAAKVLEEYVGISEDTSVYETIASLYEALGDTDKAFENYQKFVQANTSSEADALYEEAIYKLQRGSYEEAIGLFDQCLAQEEPTDGAWYNRGLCHMTMGDYEAAIEDFAQSVEKESFAKEALYTKATCEMTILSYEDAVADFTACIEQEADPENSRINRGICLLLSGKSQEAVEDFNQCIDEDINADEARFYRSFVYLADEEYDKALEDLTVCIENGYDLPASYQQRASVYREMGNEEAYAADLEAAKKAAEEARAQEAQVGEESISEVADVSEEANADVADLAAESMTEAVSEQ